MVENHTLECADISEVRIYYTKHRHQTQTISFFLKANKERINVTMRKMIRATNDSSMVIGKLLL